MCAKNQPRPTLYFPFSACQLRESKFGRRREAFPKRHYQPLSLGRWYLSAEEGKGEKEDVYVCQAGKVARELNSQEGG